MAQPRVGGVSESGVRRALKLSNHVFDRLLGPYQQGSVCFNAHSYIAFRRIYSDRVDAISRADLFLDSPCADTIQVDDYLHGRTSQADAS